MAKFIIKQTPEFEEEYDNLRLKNKKINKIFWPKLNNFEKIFLENDHISPQMYYKNIETAHIHERNVLTEKKGKDIGYFLPHKCYIWVRSKFHVYHELLHLASTINNNDYIYSGFSQDNFHDNIGDGLNEGYTSLLEYRYFYHEGADMGYGFELVIARLIEELVGQKTMEKLYFQANLFDLIKKLEKYASYQEIYSFILKLDILSEVLNNDILYYLFYPSINILKKAIINFIEKCKIKKLDIYLEDKKITTIEYEELLNDFYDTISELNQDYDYKILKRKNNS